MGGVLAIYLALKYKVSKLILLSASLKYIDMKQLYKISVELMKKRNLLTDEEKNIIINNFNRVKNMSIQTIFNFTEVVRLVTPYLEHINQPIMIVQGLKDGLVPSRTAQLIFDKVSSKNKILYFSPNGYHQICFSDDRMQWFGRVFDFIQEKKEI